MGCHHRRFALPDAFIRGVLLKKMDETTMPNSTGGINVSILAGQTRQANKDCTAAHTAPGASNTTASFLDEFINKMMAAGTAVETAMWTGDRLNLNVEQALEALYRIICHFRPDPADGRKPVSSDAGVSKPEVSVHDISKIVQFLSCSGLKPATVQACAELLWLAEQKEIAQHDFRRFLREVGGVAVRTMAADIMAE